MSQKFSSKTPIRLQDAVYAAFVKHYRNMIQEHGATYAVNYAIVSHLRSEGEASISDPLTSGDRIARGQAKRWKALKNEVRADLEKNEAQREAKRERDKKYRAKKRAEKAAQSSTPEE